MFIIKRFQEEKIVKFVISTLLCVLFLFSSFSVFADEEDDEEPLPLSPAISTEISTETSTDDSNNIIIEQPHNAVAQGGDTIAFNVKVSDSSLVDRYLWVYTADGGVSWVTASSLTGYDTDTLTLIVNRYRATWKYKCILELKNGDTLETRIASIISPSEQTTEQATEQTSEQATDFISFADSFTSSDYQLITVILLLVLIFVFLLKFIL